MGKYIPIYECIDCKWKSKFIFKKCPLCNSEKIMQDYTYEKEIK